MRSGILTWLALISFVSTGLLVGCAPAESETEETPVPEHATIGSVERLDPRLDELVPQNAQLEILAEGHEWSEGPVWVPELDAVLYSDIPQNAIYRWSEGDSAAVWLQPSGSTGERAEGGEPGSNGLILDQEGHLVLCQHGDRRIARMEAPLVDPQPVFSTIAGDFQGKRFNSPNDIVQRSNGDFYFTDPPYGLPQGADDPTKELDFQGVFLSTTDGTVTLLTDELSRPNGIGLSPDEQTLYVANSDGSSPIIMAYDIVDDGTIENGRVLFDASGMGGGFDGMAIDVEGNLFATGPGGVLVIAPDGTHLGTLQTTQATSNCTFGNDGSTLYITADMYLLRIRLTTRGSGF